MKSSLAKRIIVALVLLAFVLTAPGSIRYWYKVGSGHSVGVQFEELKRLNQEVNFSDLSNPQREQITNKAKQEGVKCAILMLAGQNIPFFLLFLMTIGILSRSTRPKFRKLLKLAFPLVCIFAVIFLSFGTTYWGMATPFPESLGPAIFIWLVIAGFFGLIIGLFKLISFLIRSQKKPKNEQQLSESGIPSGNR